MGSPRTTPDTRRLLLTGLALLLAFATFSWVVSLNVTQPFVQGMDDAWRRLVGSAPGPETAPLPLFFQQLGQGLGALVFVVLLPGALFAVRRWRSALFVLAAMVGSTLVAQLTKNLVDRPRPAADEAAGLYGPLFQVDHGSLPSGHSVTMGFIIVAVAALIPPARRWIWWVAGVLLAAGMVWQRTLINAHWLSDTLAGLAAGAGSTLILWWAFSALLERDRGKPARRKTVPKNSSLTTTDIGAS